MLTRLAHQTMLALQGREARAFRREIPEAAARQRTLLQGYLKAHARTALGRAYGIGEVRSYQEFAKRVPILDYEAHRPFINRLAAGETDMLHPGKTLFLEETSGSSGGPKLIPYGRRLQGEFQSGLSAWMHALAAAHPGIFKGRMYWSLSPALRPFRRTEAGLAIGVEDDTGYFDPLKALLLKAALAVPESLRKLHNADDFYRATLVALLATPCLSFISCWSPLFFLQLDRFLLRNREEILAALRKHPGLQGKNPDAHRIAGRMEILQGPFTWADLWPELACLSCWTHGSSELWIASLQDRLGPIPLQGKGLLSTECFVSFPFESGLDPVLSYRSHFFEFREEADGLQGAIVPMEGLRLSGVYEVIVTTGGGLCRYPTGDLVQVTSMASGLPSLRFLRRREGWTDMAGEKVSESAALAALQDLRKEAYQEILGGALVACAEVPGGPRYRLHLEWKGSASRPDAGRTQAVASAMEKRLAANPYYRQARGLGQLEKLEVTDLVRGSMERLLDRYKLEKKVADGNVKLPFLFDNRDWHRLGEEHASPY